VEVFAMSLLI